MRTKMKETQLLSSLASTAYFDLFLSASDHAFLAPDAEGT